MWAKVSKGHRIEAIAKQEGCGQRGRLQTMELVAAVAEPPLGGDVWRGEHRYRGTRGSQLNCNGSEKMR